MDNEEIARIVGWHYSKDFDLWVRGDHAVDALPAYVSDLGACVAELDRTGRDWRLYNYDDSVFNTHYQCWLDGFDARGKTLIEAIHNALVVHYR